VHFDATRLYLSGHGNDAIPLLPLASGVDLFFVISGFVMVYSSENLFGKPWAAKEFLARRVARVVPLYWVTMALWIWLQQEPFDAVTLLKSYFFIPYVRPSGNVLPLYGIGWTLNFEMFFYVLFAAAIMLCRNTAVAIVCATLLAAVLLGGTFHPTITALAFWTDPIVLEFAFGMVLAVLYRRGLRIPAWLGALFCVAGAIAIWHASPSMPSGDRWLTCGVPAAMIFFGLVFQPPLRLSIRWLSALGDASYSIYLLHGLVISCLNWLWPIGLNRWFAVQDVIIGGFLFMIAAALLSYRFFEMPVSRWLRRTLASRAPQIVRAGAVPQVQG
jgi:peptidoglycan/LPS O-acetylase OafA/YrhL